MSNAPGPVYSPIYIKAWTILSILLGAFLFSLFLFGNTFIAAGKPAWDLIRWIFSPII